MNTRRTRLRGLHAAALAAAALALSACAVGAGGAAGQDAGQADDPDGLPGVPERRPDRQAQPVAGGGAARLHDQVDEVRLRGRHQHRLRRRRAGLRCDRVEPGGPRPVRAAEHPVPGGVRAGRRRRQRGAGRPQRQPASPTSPDLRGKKVATPFASTAHYSLLAALHQAGLSAVGRAARRPAAAGILAAWSAATSTPSTPGCRRWTSCGRTARQLIASRQLATAGKPTLDLGVVSTAFAQAHPDASTPGARPRPGRCTLIADDPGAAAAAIGAGDRRHRPRTPRTSSSRACSSPAELSSAEWLGTEGKPGNVAQNLHSAAQFLAEQKQIPARRPTWRRPEGDLREGAARCPRKLRRRPRNRSRRRRAADPTARSRWRGQPLLRRPARRRCRPSGRWTSTSRRVSSSVLVGASGCGKSTLLRLIAGFERPTEGTVTVSGGPPLPGAGAGVVFQQPRLFPWSSVGGNVDLALSYAGVRGKADGCAREELLRRVGLAGRPTARSGRSPAASSSGSRSPGRSPRGPRCCCSTSRSPRWTRSPVNGCRRNCAP